MIVELSILAAATPGDVLQTQSLFDPAYLFQPVPQLAGQIRPIFELLAFTILSAAGVRRWLGNPYDKLMGIVPVIIAGLFVAIIPLSLNTADQAVDDLVAKTGLADPNTVFAKLMALSQAFHPINEGEQINVQKLQTAQQAGGHQYAKEQVRQHSFWGIDLTGAIDFITNAYNGTTTSLKVAYDTVKAPLNAFGDALRMMIFKALAFLGAGLVWLMMQVCALICYVYVSIRFLLIHLESIVLPVFVAMIVTDSLRGQGTNFVMGLGGIIFWPLGWALGHIGTLAIGNWYASVLAGLLGIQNGNVNLTDGQVFDWITNGDALGLQAATPQTQVCIILVALVGAGILCLWVFIVTVSAPFIIAKALKSGSGMFGEMMGGTAKGVAALGAAAAGLAAIAMAGGATAGAVGAQAAAKETAGGSSDMPVGANAPLALENGAFNRAGSSSGGSGGSGSSSRIGPLANRATSRMPPGSGGLYAASSDGSAAFIPLSQSEMSSLVSGGSSGGGANGGGGSGSSNGEGGIGSGGSSGKKVAKVTGSSAKAYRAVMAMGALQGALEAASQWDGGADVVSHTASRASSGATNQYDRARRLDRQDFDDKQNDDEKA